MSIHPTVVLALVAVLTLLSFTMNVAAQTMEIVSVDAAGVPVPEGGGMSSISSDGRYVAFVSSSVDLAGPGTNPSGGGQVFVFDRVTGTTALITKTPAGVPMPPTTSCLFPCLSATGRFVVFSSDGCGLVPGFCGPPGVFQVFRHDRDMDLDGILDETGAVATIAISVTPSGLASSESSFTGSQSISADGDLVVFECGATDLVSPAPVAGHCYLRTVSTATTTIVSSSSAGIPGDDGSSQPAINAAGTAVAFTSSATNLSSTGDGNGLQDVFVKSLVSGAITRVSVGPLGAESSGASATPAIDASGTKTVFVSGAADLLGTPDLNGKADVFVHDSVSGVTTRASVSFTGGDSTGKVEQPGISADGKVVVFTSTSADLVAGVGPGQHVYARHLPSAATFAVSSSLLGIPGDSGSGEADVSEDGSSVVFSSGATNLGPATSPGLFVKNGFLPPAPPVSIVLTEVVTGIADFVEITNIGPFPELIAGATILLQDNSLCPPLLPTVYTIMGTATPTVPGVLLPGESYIVQDCGVFPNPPLLVPSGECTGFNIPFSATQHLEVVLEDASGVARDYVQVHTIGSPPPLNGFRNNPPGVVWPTAPVPRPSPPPAMNVIRRRHCPQPAGPVYRTLKGSASWVVEDALPTPAALNPPGGPPYSPFPGLDLAVTTPAAGAVVLAIATGLRPLPGAAELYIVFSLLPSSCAGSGPILGMPADIFAQIILPLGTDPFHVSPAADGTYAFSAAGIAPGNSVEARAGLLAPGVTGPILLLSNYVYFTTL